MAKLTITKTVAETKYFNNNQKVYVENITGSDSSLVRGRFRGMGRYVKAWTKKKYLRWPLMEVEVEQRNPDQL
jgi:hypothetical protein